MGFDSQISAFLVWFLGDGFGFGFGISPFISWGIALRGKIGGGSDLWI